MAHNLNMRPDGRASMMYIGTSPWHELGLKLPKLATSAEAIEAAGLDYTVEKRTLYTLAEQKRLVEIPDQFCTIRTMETFLKVASRLGFLKSVPESFEPDQQKILAYLKRTGSVPEGCEFIAAEVRFSYTTTMEEQSDGANDETERAA